MDFKLDPYKTCQAVCLSLSDFLFPDAKSRGLVQSFLRRVQLLPRLIDENRRYYEPGGVQTEDVEPPVVRMEARTVGEIVKDFGEEVQQGAVELANSNPELQHVTHWMSVEERPHDEETSGSFKPSCETFHDNDASVGLHISAVSLCIFLPELCQEIVTPRKSTAVKTNVALYDHVDATAKGPPAQRGPLPRRQHTAESVLFGVPPGQEENDYEGAQGEARNCGIG